MGNLQREFSEGDVKDMFSIHGQVDSVAIIRDHATRRSKGFAFVEMPLSAQARAAIKALNGQVFHQPTRTLAVREAGPRPDRKIGHEVHPPDARVGRQKLPNRGFMGIRRLTRSAPSWV